MTEASGAELYRWAAAAEAAGDTEQARLLRIEAAQRPYRTPQPKEKRTDGR